MHIGNGMNILAHHFFRGRIFVILNTDKIVTAQDYRTDGVQTQGLKAMPLFDNCVETVLGGPAPTPTFWSFFAIISEVNMIQPS
jgi:hypothetical protein